MTGTLLAHTIDTAS